VTGGVDQNVEASKLADGRIDRGLALLAIRYVNGQRQRFCARTLDRVGNLSKAFLVPSQGDYVRGRFRKFHGDSVTNAGSGSSDDHDFVCKITFHQCVLSLQQHVRLLLYMRYQLDLRI
jgi:hypothetical protein